MRKIIGNIILLLLPAILIILYYRHYATSGDSWSVQCSFHTITGWQCPGCGGQRAFYYLLQGDLLKTLRYNVLVLLIAPVLFYCYYVLGQIYLVGNKKFSKYLNFKAWHAYLFLVILLMFFLLRNIPVFPFTSLSPA